MKFPFLTSALMLSISAVSAQAETSTTGGWGGCYLSGGLSLAKGDASATDRPYDTGPLAGQGITWGGTTPSFDITADKAVGARVGVGCDRLFDLGGKSFVLGGIADVATGLSGGSGANPAATDSQFSYDIDSIATLRGRAGLVEDKNLYYLTGGLAFAKTRTRAFDTSTTPGIGTMDVSGGGTDMGWVIGAGIEWQVKSNVTMSVEFLHHEFGGATASGQASFPVAAHPRFDSTMRENTLSIGFNWRL